MKSAILVYLLLLMSAFQQHIPPTRATVNGNAAEADWLCDFAVSINYYTETEKDREDYVYTDLKSWWDNYRCLSGQMHPGCFKPVKGESRDLPSQCNFFG